jgi:chromate reductase
MNKSIRILAFSGSLREGSFNGGLLKAAQEILTKNNILPQVEFEIFDLSSVPLFNIDLKSSGEPESVRTFKQAIAVADALLIATPEYNASIPGVLKNAIDWASHPRSQSPLAGKPLAILGAGGRSGTVHAQRHLREIALHLNMQVLEQPEILVDRAWEKFDQHGHLTDPKVRSAIAGMLGEFIRMFYPPALSIDVIREDLRIA